MALVFIVTLLTKPKWKRKISLVPDYVSCARFVQRIEANASCFGPLKVKWNQRNINDEWSNKYCTTDLLHLLDLLAMYSLSFSKFYVKYVKVFKMST